MMKKRGIRWRQGDRRFHLSLLCYNEFAKLFHSTKFFYEVILFFLIVHLFFTILCFSAKRLIFFHRPFRYCSFPRNGLIPSLLFLNYFLSNNQIISRSSWRAGHLPQTATITTAQHRLSHYSVLPTNARYVVFGSEGNRFAE